MKKLLLNYRYWIVMTLISVGLVCAVATPVPNNNNWWIVTVFSQIIGWGLMLVGINLAVKWIENSSIELPEIEE